MSFTSQSDELFEAARNHNEEAEQELARLLKRISELESMIRLVHVAAPAAIGEHVLQHAPAGPVLLTQPQREELTRVIINSRQRISDLKFAMGDSAGWFDRARVAESTVAKLNKLICDHIGHWGVCDSADDDGESLVCGSDQCSYCALVAEIDGKKVK
jgi:hypothetical protein